MALHDVRYDPGISQWSVILGDDRLVYGFGDVSRYQVATANPPGPGREYLQLVGNASQLMEVVTPGRGRVTYFGATATGAWSQRALQSADLPVVRRLEMSRMAEFRFQGEATIPLEEAVDSGCVAWGEVGERMGGRASCASMYVYALCMCLRVSVCGVRMGGRALYVSTCVYALCVCLCVAWGDAWDERAMHVSTCVYALHVCLCVAWGDACGAKELCM